MFGTAIPALVWGSLLLLTYFWPVVQLSLFQLPQIRCFQQKDVLSTSVPPQVLLPFLTVRGEANPQARQDP